MIAIQIIDIKNFMAKLLLQDTFDAFLLQQVRVLTASELILNGRRSREWYDQEQWQALGELSDAEMMSWKELKNTVFQYIKGKQAPQRMWIDFRVSALQAESFLADSGSYSKYRQYLPALHLQVRYEEAVLRLVTAVSFSEFVMDKSIEQAWDEAICQYLGQMKIVFDLLNKS